MSNKISRRSALGTGLKITAASLLGFGFIGEKNNIPGSMKKPGKEKLPFRVSLNTSTLTAYKLPVDKQIDLVGKAGFDGIELWMRDIKAYVDAGGSLASLKEKLKSYNLVLENIIAFSKWCSDEASERKEALDLMRSEMSMIAELGGHYFAAPVQGIEKIDPTKLEEYAQRYRAVLEVGDEVGVIPLIELWGMGALHKVSDCAQIVIGSKHPKAAMLLDFYHVHRGGNSWATIDTLNAGRLPVIHMNDYPGSPQASLLTDADRILPGEGVCPFDEVLPKLYKAGFRGGLSVELFNKGYWESMDAETLLKKSYDTTRLTIEKAMPNFK
ncbi:sugar phosphate isomerase/epimerase family protein [Maribacter halichondriae]|uniref:sugar phosphate isomerase/epimerase family protein n=1 Tax=Maribacter halichondriae TaxID=2980554 RepID=UPI002359960A|nr:sugar phosphate isomerase/epimerase family protein [Maribacter sp. Hal144]